MRLRSSTRPLFRAPLALPQQCSFSAARPTSAMAIVLISVLCGQFMTLVAESCLWLRSRNWKVSFAMLSPRFCAPLAGRFWISPVLLSGTNARAFATLPHTMPDIEVRTSKGMTSLTDRLSFLSGSNSDAAQDICARCHRFQMVRIDTITNSTKVIQRQPYRNRSSQVLIHGAVRRSASAVYYRSCVALPQSTRPEPALVFASADQCQAINEAHSAHAFCHEHMVIYRQQQAKS